MSIFSYLYLDKAHGRCRHCAPDSHTHEDCVHNINEAWGSQYPDLVNAYLQWDCHGAPPDVQLDEVAEEDVVGILCIDIFGMYHSILQVLFSIHLISQHSEHGTFKSPNLVSSEPLNTMLTHHGHSACAPMDPSLAFSFQALDLYRVLGTRCPEFSIQAFVHSLCDLHHVSMV